MIERTVASFRVRSDLVAGTDGLRLDASFYNAEVIEALAVLDRTGMPLETVGSLTERVFIPNRFPRNYVGSDHGVPFLQGSHIIQFKPDDVKYLSLATHTNIEGLLIHEGWLLLTRSGTVGRVALVTSQWDGWAASEHIFRIVPRADTKCPHGYLAAFLSSPIGQLQLTRQIYGAVVDELTVDHIRRVRVPLPRTRAETAEVQRISDLAVKAAKMRAAAVALTTDVETGMTAFLPAVQVPDDAPGMDTRLKIDADPEDALRAMLRASRQP